MHKERQQRRVWAEQEDEKLRQAVVNITQNGKPKWKQIASHLNQTLMSQFPRNPKQCRERWTNVLKSIQAQPTQWTLKDDVSLIQACKKHGHRWAKLVNEFDGQINDNRLKNHFYSNLRKVVRHINNLLKKVKKEQQRKAKEDAPDDPQNQELFQAVAKIRNFQPKYFSKVFSLLDSKQQFKYQAKEAVEVQNLKILNQRILDLIEDFITQSNVFSEKDTLYLVLEIMQINKCVKTKYVRESKMSINTKEEIQKAHQQKKKIDKKLCKLVKNELKNKIIPNKKIIDQVIEKIKETSKFRRLIKPKNNGNTKSPAATKNSSNQSEDNSMRDEKQQNLNENEWKANDATEKQKNSEFLQQSSSTLRKPFESKFLNSIPVAEGHQKNSEQKNNFIFPQNFAFPPLFQNQEVFQRENIMQKSFPFLFQNIQAEPAMTQRNSLEVVNEEFNPYKNKKGLVSSIFYQPQQNQQKRSQCSDRMRSSICDLISDYNPHVSAFQPVNSPNESRTIRFGQFPNLQRSQPYSMIMPNFNLMDSQPFYNHELMSTSGQMRKKQTRVSDGKLSQSCTYSDTRKQKQKMQI